MKLEVPFIQQTTKFNCGPVALQMIFSYLGGSESLDILEEKCGIKDGKAVSTLSLAICAKELGYDVELNSDSFEIDESLMDLDYYKKHGGVNWADEVKRLIEEAKEKGVKLTEGKLELKDILDKISEECIPIALLDWNVIKGKEEYLGHFVPIIGYDEENVLVHNQGMLNPTSFLEISRDVFDKARNAKGTDGDILFLKK
ncbi:hypothetical protein HOF78_00675 [Candidatus Woesearchaeota archaeon]|jgi:hypothetical protein|nr:hypothetical protein [Candidatus Woesearchaeota archaeon]MBT6045085.1 hypothetical protein [Candidatus Woesearchaeota archaeon]